MIGILQCRWCRKERLGNPHGKVWNLVFLSAVHSPPLFEPEGLKTLLWRLTLSKSALTGTNPMRRPQSAASSVFFQRQSSAFWCKHQRFSALSCTPNTLLSWRRRECAKILRFSVRICDLGPVCPLRSFPSSATWQSVRVIHAGLTVCCIFPLMCPGLAEGHHGRCFQAAAAQEIANPSPPSVHKLGGFKKPSLRGQVWKNPTIPTPENTLLGVGGWNRGGGVYGGAYKKSLPGRLQM